MTAPDSPQERMRNHALDFLSPILDEDSCGDDSDDRKLVDTLTDLLTRVRAEALEEAASVAQKRDPLSAIAIRALATAPEPCKHGHSTYSAQLCGWCAYEEEHARAEAAEKMIRALVYAVRDDGVDGITERAYSDAAALLQHIDAARGKR